MREDIPATHKICVVGFADGHRDMAPWDDPEMEFWGLNRLHQVMPERRFDRWFDIHSLQKYYLANDDTVHAKFLKEFEGPVYLRPDDMGLMDVPNAVPFPIGEVLANFPDYFTNSVSWMLAFAIMELADAAEAYRADPISNPQPELHVYGVDMAQDSLLQAEYCVAPETRVLTADLRWVPASEVRVGDELIAFDEEVPEGQNFRSYRKTRVKSTSNLMRPGYRLHMSDGTKLTSSAEHRWLANGSGQFSWETSEDLHGPLATDEQVARIHELRAEGLAYRKIARITGINRSAVQRIATGNWDPAKSRRHRLVKGMTPWEDDRTRGGGYLAAAFDGEGHLSMNPRNGQNGTAVVLGFAQRDNSMAALVEECLTERGFDFSVNDSDCRNYNVKGGRSEILRFLGEMRPPRLLNNFDADKLGIVHSTEYVAIEEKEYLGEIPVVAIGTEAGTFIAEGFLSHNSEQRPSCEYFIGHAAALGIQVFIPEGSDLLKASHRYGFDDTDPIRGKLISRHRELGNRKGQLQQQLKVGDEQRAQLVAGVNQLDGAMQEIQYQMRNLMPAPEAPVEGVLPEGPPITLETLAGGLAHVQQQLEQMASEPPKAKKK